MTAPGLDIGAAPLILIAVALPWLRSKSRTVRLRNPLLVSLLCLGVGAWSWLWKGRT